MQAATRSLVARLGDSGWGVAKAFDLLLPSFIPSILRGASTHARAHTHTHIYRRRTHIPRARRRYVWEAFSNKRGELRPNFMRLLLNSREGESVKTSRGPLFRFLHIYHRDSSSLRRIFLNRCNFTRFIFRYLRCTRENIKC